MTSPQLKKEQIRRDIISAAKEYSNHLAGKSFLYVYGDEHVELLFKTDRFLHLTGVDTHQSAQSFYKDARTNNLHANQFFFSSTHPYRNAKKKLSCLTHLNDLTTKDVILLKDMTTVTLVYRIGLTNLEYTLGLTENLDAIGNKIDDMLVPRTLRVRDNPIEISRDGEFVDFIFSKRAGNELYQTLTFSDPKKILPKTVRGLVDPSFFSSKDECDRNNL